MATAMERCNILEKDAAATAARLDGFRRELDNILQTLTTLEERLRHSESNLVQAKSNLEHLIKDFEVLRNKRWELFKILLPIVLSVGISSFVLPMFNRIPGSNALPSDPPVNPRK